MRYIFLFISILTMSTASLGQSKPRLDFPLGEHIKFKINYGWFTLGEASMTLADSLIHIDGQTYYHNHIEARTVGLFSWLAGIQNEYSGYVNTQNYKTIISEKHLDERKGRMDQWNTFDYEKMQTEVRFMDYAKEPPKKEITVDLKENTYDLHGTYMFLRSKLWSGFETGDSLMMSTYWEEKLYDFGMEYGGLERIKFNGERINAHKFYGLFPLSRTFPNARAVKVWVIEKEGMGIPLLIEADMKIGKVKCELKEYTINGKRLITVK